MIDLKFKYCVAAAFVSFASALSLQAAALKSAEITAIVNDVKVVNSGQGARPAKLQETISGQSAVQTGVKSRTELLFSDKTMARLGANSMFSFTNGTRDIELQQGTMMLQVPKGAGGAKITTAAVTAAITGTTIMIEYFPGGFTKVIVLEGTLRLFLNNRVGESTLLEAGKMIILDPKSKQIPEPVDVDIKRLVKTSKLIQGIEGAELDMKLVDKEIQDQEKEKKKGNLVGTNLVITGSGTEVVIASEELLNTLQNASFEQQKLLGQNNGTNSGKYGPVTTITNPNPYVINNTTTIVTDPTITTNGVTNQGTLYNSTVQQGPTSTALFGSTSTFDTASGFDTAFLGQDYSVFRFTELQFDGSPTLNTVGGPKNLFLVSEGNISTTATPFTLDFTGLDFLGLATVDGYVSLTHPLVGPTRVDMHARGTGGSNQGTIFIDAPISLVGGSTLNLYAESEINLNSTITADNIAVRSYGDLNTTASTLIQGANVNLTASNLLTLYSNTIGLGPLVTLNAAGGEIYLDGTQDYAGKTATFNAGTSGIHGSTGTSLLNATSILSTGDINFNSGGISDVSATGIIAASGNIDVSGILTAGSVGAAVNVSAGEINSSTNINATTGSITTTGGDITALNNVTAATTIDSSNGITAGNLLQGSDITAAGNISAGSIKTTSGDITSSGGSIVTTAAKLESAADITASGGGMSSANDIIAVGDISANGGISAIGIISGHDIISTETSNGNISSGGDITATGSLGTTAAGSTTTSTGQITAATITGPASGTSTFNAGTIVVGNIASSAVILNAPTVTVNAQTTGITTDVFSSSVQNLTINGASGVTILVVNSFGTAVVPLTSLTTNANVQFSGSNDLAVTTANLGGGINLTGGNLYTDSMTVGGNVSVGTIKRTSTGGGQTITLTGTSTLAVTSTIDFQGLNGANGGTLTINGNNIVIGTGGITAANFVGGDSLTTAAGGTGGIFTLVSKTSLNQTGAISAHGGTSSGGAGGMGGTVKMSTTGASSTFNLSGSIDANGANGDTTGGQGGSIILSANDTGGIINQNAGSLNVSGGAGSSGGGGSGGTAELHAEGSGGQVNTIPYASIIANGGTSVSGPGGTGGTILMKANGVGGAVSHTSYSTSSANGGSSNGFKGGSGGNIQLVGGSVTTGPSTTLSAIGGDALSGSNEGGDGGTFTATSSTSSVLNLQGNVNLTTGNNSGVTYGGNGGTATINGGGPVTISGIIKTSEDAVGTKTSKNGGNITVTSAETDTAKPGITIANTGQLLALLNAASVGKGGKIQFTSAGGIISVAGTVDAGKKGQAGVVGTDGTLLMSNNAANGKININDTAILRGDIVKGEVLGTNGTLTITAGAQVDAASQIKFYANQSQGLVHFTGNGAIDLTAPTILINAHTVTVDATTRVNNNGATTVGAVNHNYTNGVGPTGLGGFRDPVTQTAP